MIQDFNSVGNLLELIAREPGRRESHIADAIRIVEDRIRALCAEGPAGALDVLDERLLKFGGFSEQQKRATAIGLKEKIGARNGFDLDSINQIFIATFHDFEDRVNTSFHEIFDPSNPDFMVEGMRQLKNQIVKYRNLSSIVNGGQRYLNGGYSNAKKGLAGEQFRQLRLDSQFFMVAVEILLAERYNLEMELTRFANNPSYEQYKRFFASIESWMDRVLQVTRDFHFTRKPSAAGIGNAVTYLLRLSDHYATMVNYQFTEALKPQDISSQRMDLNQLERTSVILGGKYIVSRRAFSDDTLRLLPAVNDHVARFYEMGNLVPYFANLRSVSEPNPATTR